jgi:hypothetical protein
VLGEAAFIPPAFAIVAVVAGVIAILGVIRLAKHHPQRLR